MGSLATCIRIGTAVMIALGIDAARAEATAPEPSAAWFQPLGNPLGRPPGWADRVRASALSSDGSTVVGSVDFGDELFRWSSEAGFEPIISRLARLGGAQMTCPRTDRWWWGTRSLRPAEGGHSGGLRHKA